MGWELDNTYRKPAKNMGTQQNPLRDRRSRMRSPPPGEFGGPDAGLDGLGRCYGLDLDRRRHWSGVRWHARLTAWRRRSKGDTGRWGRRLCWWYITMRVYRDFRVWWDGDQAMHAREEGVQRDEV